MIKKYDRNDDHLDRDLKRFFIIFIIMSKSESELSILRFIQIFE